MMGANEMFEAVQYENVSTENSIEYFSADDGREIEFKMNENGFPLIQLNFNDLDVSELKPMLQKCIELGWIDG